MRQRFKEMEMAAGLPVVIGVVLGVFGVFMAGLGYGTWMTRDVEVHRGDKH